MAWQDGTSGGRVACAWVHVPTNSVPAAFQDTDIGGANGRDFDSQAGAFLGHGDQDFHSASVRAEFPTSESRFKVPVDENGERVWREMEEFDTSSEGPIRTGRIVSSLVS